VYKRAEKYGESSNIHVIPLLYSLFPTRARSLFQFHSSLPSMAFMSFLSLFASSFSLDIFFNQFLSQNDEKERRLTWLRNVYKNVCLENLITKNSEDVELDAGELCQFGGVFKVFAFFRCFLKSILYRVQSILERLLIK
jgi:hypothetical protein